MTMLTEDMSTRLSSLTATQYSLLFVNNSSNSGDACVYQTDPDIGIPDVMSLAWFSKYAFPTTKLMFQWTIDYDFVWAETGELVPGVIFMASQAWPTDLSNQNNVTLTYQNLAYNFKNQTQGSEPGTLYIEQDNTIPLKQAAVGIGMSGFGTFAVQAQPNLHLTFTPHPKYWITFGNFTQGEVLDIGEITNPGEVAFPPGVTSMTAILKPDNTWSVNPTSQVSPKELKALT